MAISSNLKKQSMRTIVEIQKLGLETEDIETLKGEFEQSNPEAVNDLVSKIKSVQQELDNLNGELKELDKSTKSKEQKQKEKKKLQWKKHLEKIKSDTVKATEKEIRRN